MSMGVFGGDLIALHDGPVLVVHAPERCEGTSCCIHNPSSHEMREWPLLWRSDLGVMERRCEHGYGHPDPDDLAYRRRRFGPHYRGDVHGCDGCCPLDDQRGDTLTWA